MDLVFHKMHGLGNDFVLLDCRQQAFTLTASQIDFMGDRRTGIGFDQLLVIESSTRARVHANYRIFNQDGSSAEHCGNGVRCVAQFLHERLPDHPHTIVVEIAGKLFELKVLDDGRIRVDMGAPIFEPSQIPARFDQRALKYTVEINGEQRELGAVSMGNPHAVLRSNNVEGAPVMALGTALQTSEYFPAQVNVGFVENRARNDIRLRVWERGVGETRACGTGACAAVVVGRVWGDLDERVNVQLPGGELEIEWAGGDTDSVWMTGPAAYVFEGKIEL